MNLTKRIKMWLGWGPEYKAERTIVFEVKSRDAAVSGEGSPNPISVVDLSSIKWGDVYHNMILALIGGVTLFYLSFLSRWAKRFSGRDVLELLLIGFLAGAPLFLISSYRIVKKLNIEGKIVQLGTKKDWLLAGVVIFLSIYLGLWVVSPWLEAAYGNGTPAMSIFVVGFALSMWFFILSIIRWEKKNQKLLVIKRMGLFGSSIEAIDIEA